MGLTAPESPFVTACIKHAIVSVLNFLLPAYAFSYVLAPKPSTLEAMIPHWYQVRSVSRMSAFFR